MSIFIFSWILYEEVIVLLDIHEQALTPKSIVSIQKIYVSINSERKSNLDTHQDTFSFDLSTQLAVLQYMHLVFLYWEINKTLNKVGSYFN